MDDVKKLFESTESINLEDLEKAYKMQMANSLRLLTDSIRLAKRMQESLYVSTVNHMSEIELSDKLEEAMGTDVYIETFFTDYEIARLIALKWHEEKIEELKNKNGHYARYRIRRVSGGQANPVVKPLVRKQVQRTYEKAYKEYKYKKRQIGLTAKNMKTIIEGDFPKELKKFAIFNLDAGASEKYRVFDYKRWTYNRLTSQEKENG